MYEKKSIGFLVACLAVLLGVNSAHASLIIDSFDSPPSAGPASHTASDFDTAGSAIGTESPGSPAMLTNVIGGYRDLFAHQTVVGMSPGEVKGSVNTASGGAYQMDETATAKGFTHLVYDGVAYAGDPDSVGNTGLGSINLLSSGTHIFFTGIITSASSIYSVNVTLYDTASAMTTSSGFYAIPVGVTNGSLAIPLSVFDPTIVTQVGAIKITFDGTGSGNNTNLTIDLAQVADVPEPFSVAAWSVLGCAGLGLIRRRARVRAS